MSERATEHRTAKMIHVVFGETGEYSDHRDWIVAAYYDEQKAREHVEKASARAREIYQEAADHPEGEWAYRAANDPLPNEYDPDMKMDYTGTNYLMESVEIKDA